MPGSFSPGSGQHSTLICAYCGTGSGFQANRSCTIPQNVRMAKVSSLGQRTILASIDYSGSTAFRMASCKLALQDSMARARHGARPGEELRRGLARLSARSRGRLADVPHRTSPSGHWKITAAISPGAGGQSVAIRSPGDSAASPVRSLHLTGHDWWGRDLHAGPQRQEDRHLLQPGYRRGQGICPRRRLRLRSSQSPPAG